MSYVTLHKLLNLFILQILYPYNEKKSKAYFLWLLWGLTKMI